MPGGPNLSLLSHEQKDALITALMAQVGALTARVAELEAKLGLPPKTPDNSSLPPSKGQRLRLRRLQRWSRRQWKKPATQTRDFSSRRGGVVAEARTAPDRVALTKEAEGSP